jgi:hypothetical protein
MRIDDRTFGDSPAGIKMVEIIVERDLNFRKPARLLNRFDKITNDLNHVDVTSAIHLMNLLYKESYEKCEAFDEPLNTYTQNVLSTKFKKWQIRKNALGLKKNR